MKTIAVVFIVALLLASSALADVGAGISPARNYLKVESGKQISQDFLVFNTGDAESIVHLSVEGELAQFATLSVSEFSVLPEPKPHEMPIKNGKTFTVTFAPKTDKEKLVGAVIATITPAPGSMLSGSVAVSSDVELAVSQPPAAAFPIGYAIAALVLVMLIIFIIAMMKRRKHEALPQQPL